MGREKATLLDYKEDLEHVGIQIPFASKMQPYWNLMILHLQQPLQIASGRAVQLSRFDAVI